MREKRFPEAFLTNTHWCVWVRWQADCCRCSWCCAWWRRWRCCKAGRVSGLAWRGRTAASPAGPFWDRAGRGGRMWRGTRWSGCGKALARPIAAPPRSPPRAARGDRRGATGLGTVATLLNVKFRHYIMTELCLQCRRWATASTGVTNDKLTPFGVTRTDLSHSLCPCVRLCTRSCSSLSCHSCTGHGFHKVAVHTGSPLGGDRDKQLIQHGLRLLHNLVQVNLLLTYSWGSAKPLTHLALVPKEAVFAHTQIIPSVTPTHASIKTGVGLTPVLLCTQLRTVQLDRCK